MKKQRRKKKKKTQNKKYIYIFFLLHAIVVKLVGADHFATLLSLSFAVAVQCCHHHNHRPSLLLFVEIIVVAVHCSCYSRPLPSIVYCSSINVIVHHCPSHFRPMSVSFCLSNLFCPRMSVRRCSSSSTCRIFLIVCITYIRTQYHILQTICTNSSRSYIGF